MLCTQTGHKYTQRVRKPRTRSTQCSCKLQDWASVCAVFSSNELIEGQSQTRQSTHIGSAMEGAAPSPSASRPFWSLPTLILTCTFLRSLSTLLQTSTYLMFTFRNVLGVLALQTFFSSSIASCAPFWKSTASFIASFLFLLGVEEKKSILWPAAKSRAILPLFSYA